MKLKTMQVVGIVVIISLELLIGVLLTLDYRYQNLKTVYEKLSSDFDALSKEHKSLQISYLNLQGNQTALSKNLSDLQHDYSSLNQSFTIISLNYSSFMETYRQALSRISDLDALPYIVDYTIETDGSGNYRAIKYNGEALWISPNKTYTIQSAIDALTSGTIYLKDLTLPTVTLKAGVTIINEKIEARMFDDGLVYICGKTGKILGEKSIPKFDANGNGFSLPCFKDGYLFQGTALTSASYSVAIFQESIGYGVYEWKGKITGASAGSNRYVGWGFHQYYREHIGGMEVYYDGILNKWYLWSSDGVQEANVITGIDWTVEHTFRLDWTAQSVKLYIDDVLKATNSMHPPSATRLFPFQEIINTDAASVIKIWSKDWLKLP